MEIRGIITQRQLTTEINEVNTTDNCDPIDTLFYDLSDLVNMQFKAWYCKMFYKHGRDKVMIMASRARADGYDQRKYFSKLLKG